MAHAERRVLSDPASLAETAARWVAEEMRTATALRGHCRVALAGGRTPQPVYERLRAPPVAGLVPWQRVEVYFSDERCVPPDDPDSNYAMAAAALLRHVPVPATQVHRMAGERSDHQAAAREYENVLPVSLDLLLLGMGADGHTASLFPRSRALRERTRRVVPAQGPHPLPWRLTITPPVIAAAQRIAVIVSGAEKGPAVARALTGPYRPRELPIQLALDGVWFLDAAAAAPWRERTR